MRQKLIEVIFKYASDEFESTNDVLKLAKESEEKLIDRLDDLIAYYKNEIDKNYQKQEILLNCINNAKIDLQMLINEECDENQENYQATLDMLTNTITEYYV